MLTSVMRRLSLEWHVLTPVRERDVHSTPVPRLGGVAMSLGFAVALVVASQLPYFEPVYSTRTPWMVLIGVLAITALGLVDDVWDLDWTAKLAGQVLVAVFLAYQGVQLVTFPIFGITIGSSTLSLGVTIFVFVAMMNAVNFVDGLDGLATGVVAIGATAFFIYSYMLTRTSGALTYASTASLIIAVLLGICLGFLPHNFHPGTIFMGDSGALSLGTITACATIIVTGQLDPLVLGEPQLLTSLLPIVLPIIILAIPITDMTLAVIRRLRAGKSPFHADRKHIHHRLLDIGHSHTGVVLLLYLWTALVTFPTVALLVYPPKWVLLATAPAFIFTLFLTVNLLPGLGRIGLACIGKRPDRPASPVGEEDKLDA
ncbi:MAG: MraY family glycosyltransferase [Actinomycetaceae bacterium]|nr:MraY family glycosyltransferase [Actinomycetaceae bacterium]